MADKSLPFTLVTYPPNAEANAVLDRRPEDLRAFYADGVARSFASARYRADDLLSVTLDEEGNKLVRFGSTSHGAMCLDPGSGEVVELVGPAAKRFVANSSLRAFTAVVRQVSQAFPFYPNGASDEEIEAAAEQTAEAIRRVDEEALVSEDGYWSTFIDDMLTGDWATDDVLYALGRLDQSATDNR
jgi:hypothetical protein